MTLSVSTTRFGDSIPAKRAKSSPSVSGVKRQASSENRAAASAFCCRRRTLNLPDAGVPSAEEI